MSTKSRQSIYGGAIIGAKIRAKNAREAAVKALRDADRGSRPTLGYILTKTGEAELRLTSHFPESTLMNPKRS